MTNLLIRHRVNDFEVWKEEFEAFAKTRKSFGEKSFQVFRPEGDAENLHLIFEWDNVENARRFLESSELKSAMQKAGVKDAPEIKFFEESYKGAL